MTQNSKTQIVTKLKKSNCDISKSQIVTKLKMWYCGKTHITMFMLVHILVIVQHILFIVQNNLFAVQNTVSIFFTDQYKATLYYHTLCSLNIILCSFYSTLEYLYNTLCSLNIKLSWLYIKLSWLYSTLCPFYRKHGSLDSNRFKKMFRQGQSDVGWRVYIGEGKWALAEEEENTLKTHKLCHMA